MRLLDQVRAKYMTLEPAKNRYVAHMRAIRVIQVSSGSLCISPTFPLRHICQCAWSLCESALPLQHVGAGRMHVT